MGKGHSEKPDGMRSLATESAADYCFTRRIFALTNPVAFCIRTSMKLFRFLLPALAAASSLLGAERVMFVGDSITHGVGAGSYRWPLHRLWVDNGMSFDVVGVHVGNHSRGIKPGTEYGGVAFNNRHSAITSERASEIAGRNNKSGRLGNSNIHDWLGLDTTYTGPYRIDPAKQMPDLFFILIGTNDALGDNAGRGGVGAGKNLAQLKKNMLGAGGDMDTIVGLCAGRIRRQKSWC